MNKKINVGIIGFGASGRVFHAPIINSISNFNIAKIQTSKDENINRAKNKYPWVEVVPNIDEILNDSNIELVVICVPNSSHYEIAKLALLSGKHVVVEKPFTVTSKEAGELIQIAHEQNRILTVYHNRRCDSDFLTIKKVVEDNLLGNIVEYEAHFDRFRNYIKNAWKEEDLPGSGLLYDLGSHLIDQAQCLFGVPKEITADLRIQRDDGKVIDNFEVILGYEKVKVTLKAGMLVRQPLPRFILLGDKGSFVKYGMDVQEAALNAGYSPQDLANWGEEPEDIWGTLNTEINGLHFVGKLESVKGNYRAFYENVYIAIIAEEKLEVLPEVARNTIRIIELALVSSKEKRTVKFY